MIEILPGNRPVAASGDVVPFSLKLSPARRHQSGGRHPVRKKRQFKRWEGTPLRYGEVFLTLWGVGPTQAGRVSMFWGKRFPLKGGAPGGRQNAPGQEEGGRSARRARHVKTVGDRYGSAWAPVFPVRAQPGRPDASAGPERA